ncbi:MAG: GntR family transcriptional regulator [Actinobacteria bacterium]|nr:GntR family transcriptional regulator [Actinomycetota bacterium]
MKGPPQSLPHLAADKIRERIENGELRPGDRLPPERLLTTQLAVSRTSLREALRMLESMGLLEAHVGRGRFVVEQTDDRQSVALVRNWLRAHREEIVQLNEIRTALERLSIAGLQGGKAAAVAEELRPILAEARDAARRKDSVRAAELDRNFHRTLCGATPNRPLQALVLGLIDAAQQAAGAVYAIPAAARNSLRQHAQIIECLAEGDVGSAQFILETHFERSIAVAAGRPKGVDNP